MAETEEETVVTLKDLVEDWNAGLPVTVFRMGGHADPYVTRASKYYQEMIWEMAFIIIGAWADREFDWTEFNQNREMRDGISQEADQLIADTREHLQASGSQAGMAKQAAIVMLCHDYAGGLEEGRAVGHVVVERPEVFNQETEG